MPLMEADRPARDLPRSHHNGRRSMPRGRSIGVAPIPCPRHSGRMQAWRSGRTSRTSWTRSCPIRRRRQRAQFSRRPADHCRRMTISAECAIFRLWSGREDTRPFPTSSGTIRQKRQKSAPAAARTAAAISRSHTKKHNCKHNCARCSGCAPRRIPWKAGLRPTILVQRPHHRSPKLPFVLAINEHPLVFNERCQGATRFESKCQIVAA